MGIIRISGAYAKEIGTALCGKELPPRRAVYATFTSTRNVRLDTGLAIFFNAPNSFTGEDVVELHGHGGIVVQDMLLAELLERGVRQARAGEFSERAFLNNKLDLAQAEAIADLIDSSTQAAARGALRALKGDFSKKINALNKKLIELRVYVEAAIDFPDEEIDFLADEGIRNRVKNLNDELALTVKQAGEGSILRNGLNVVLAGKPNAGKSSLLNALAGEQTAIVTDVPGTTRDIVRQTINLDGLPLHLLDTAGLRNTYDEIEKIGVQRAQEAIDSADLVLHLIDVNDTEPTEKINHHAIITVLNKIDTLKDLQAHKRRKHFSDAVYISALTGDGLPSLKTVLKRSAGYEVHVEGSFTARRRHVVALEKAQAAIELGLKQLQLHNAGELLADELRQAQNHLSEITGEYCADDLLGEIFAGFCIGK